MASHASDVAVIDSAVLDQVDGGGVGKFLGFYVGGGVGTVLGAAAGGLGVGYPVGFLAAAVTHKGHGTPAVNRSIALGRRVGGRAGLVAGTAGGLYGFYKGAELGAYYGDRLTHGY